jgi:hypothetical protein
MPHVEQSPITVWFNAIREIALLKTQSLPMYLGAEHLKKSTGPRRIVFFPTEGAFRYPEPDRRRNTTAPPLADDECEMSARIWAESLDHAWDIRSRLIQSLKQYTAEGGRGYRVDGNRTAWGQSPDSEQGEACTMTFRLVLPIERVADDEATIATVVESTQLRNPATGDATAGPTITITE